MDNLMKYRLDNAKEKLESAKLLLDAGKYRDSIGRSYYAIFTAVRAVLANDKVDFSKHSGVSAYFRKEYIKTGIFDVELSDIISMAFVTRSNSDYDDFYVISIEEVNEQIENAIKFCDIVESYLAGKL